MRRRITVYFFVRGLASTALIAGAALITGCASVPLTNRSQLQLVPMSQMSQLSNQEYNKVLDENRKKIRTSGRDVAMIRRVGRRIAAATEAFVAANNLNLQFDWEFNLIDDPKQVNAWCMPGGKVAFYSGILPFTRDDAGVAVVMGHEVAHALARHGSERFSQQMLAQMGTYAVAEAVKNQPAATAQLLMAAVGAGTTLGVLLPYGRLQEFEADHIGLILMAKAGYDPRAAVPFWQRMAAGGKAKPPEFLSTHPSDERRIVALQRYMPEALQEFRQRR